MAGKKGRSVERREVSCGGGKQQGGYLGKCELRRATLSLGTRWVDENWSRYSWIDISIAIKISPDRKVLPRQVNAGKLKISRYTTGLMNFSFRTCGFSCTKMWIWICELI